MIIKQVMLLGLSLAVVMLIAAQCNLTIEPETGAPASGPKVMVRDAWSRPSPMVAGNGAVYMHLINEGDSPDVLLSVTAEVAEVVELHETKMEGEIMKMSPIPNIEIPAGGSALLEPGGMHIMLVNLQEELVPGEKITLTLTFEKSDPMTVTAEIREMGMGATIDKVNRS